MKIALDYRRWKIHQPQHFGRAPYYLVVTIENASRSAGNAKQDGSFPFFQPGER